MAGKKDFGSINTSRVFGAIDKATAQKGQQGTADAAEAEERAQELRTQGRKGCKATRINMAFTPDNHRFIKTMAKATGHTMTEFTNIVIAAYQKEHPEFLEQAQNFLDTVNNVVWSDLGQTSKKKKK